MRKALNEKRLFQNRFSKRVKTPTVIQMESVECGAAALAIILGYWGKYTPLEELRVSCGVSRDGSKAGNIAKAARKYGLIVKACRFEPEELTSIPLPAIIHWNFNHFLVLEGFDRGYVYLNDPAGGPYKATGKEFDQGFTGVTLMFQPSPEFIKSGKRRTFFDYLSKNLEGLFSPLTFLFLTSFLLVIPGLLTSWFSKIFIDQILSVRIEGLIMPFLIGLLLVSVFKGITSMIRSRTIIKFQNELSIKFSSRFLRHLLKLPMEFFMQRFAGDIASRVSYNDALSGLITGRLATTVLDLFMAVIFFIVMFIYSPLLTIVGAGIALLNLLFLIALSHKRSNQKRRLVSDEGKFRGTSIAGLEMMDTIKAGGLESDFFSLWAGFQAKLLNAEQQMKATLTILMTIPLLLSALNSTAVLALGAWQVIQGKITLGTLLAFEGLLASFIAPINDLVNFGDEIQDLKVYMERLEDVYDYPAPKDAPDIHIKPEDTGKIPGFVELKNITFGYSRLEPPLIEDFNLTLNPGEHVAIVGGSGSGKSTLARLIAGLYTPWSGELFFDGKKRNEINAETLQRSFSLVDQEISLFEGTVRDNITMWNEAIPEDDLLSAAKDACIDTVILDREKGFLQELGENGSGFSGGEKQRIEIARAFAVNPSILVLDEATSALDPLIEKNIVDNIRKRKCSCIIIAHRLSTIKDCDEIIVLEHGRVVERGTHTQLITRNGEYARLISNE